MKNQKTTGNNDSLTEGLANKIGIIAWGLIFLGLVISIPHGSSPIIIARLALIGAAIALIWRVRKPQQLSFRTFALIEILCIGVIIAMGAMSRNGQLIAVGVLMILYYVLANLILRIEKWGEGRFLFNQIHDFLRASRRKHG